MIYDRDRAQEYFSRANQQVHSKNPHAQIWEHWTMVLRRHQYRGREQSINRGIETVIRPAPFRLDWLLRLG